MAKVDTKHPEYSDRMDEWELMRHTSRGVKAVYEADRKYLPMPSGFKSQPDDGRAMYLAYKLRARFPEILAPTLRGMVGLIHRTEAQIEMPEVMRNLLWEHATPDGLPLEAFHRRITSELLLMGRYAILTDVPDGGGDPYFAGYKTEGLINWSHERDFYVLDETGPRRSGFEWRDRKQFRELLLENEQYVQRLHEGESLEPTQTIVPSARGGGALDFIPLVVISPRDLSNEVYEPPLIGVARASLAMYQLDADYRHQLFMTGQETLFVSGQEDSDNLPKYIGAGVVHGLPLQAKAEYVGPKGVGISAHRTAIEDSRSDAVNSGAALFDRQSGQESGEALRLRYSVQTASLTTISQTSAQALETALKHAAIFMGQDPDKIIVKPNLQFVETVMTPKEARELVDVWMSGAISKLTLYENLQRGEIASAERDFEDEEELIDAETIDTPTPSNTPPDETE